VGESAGNRRLYPETIMTPVFPSLVHSLPKADLSIPGLEAYISQSAEHQILFMSFSKDAEVPEHSHESQWGVVLEGRIDLCVAGSTTTFQKGDRYFIPAGVIHSAKIFAGYADMTFFDSPSRYRQK
jgi:quercetin dioxygenase-like cupin family protein